MCCICLHTFHRWGGLVFIVDVLQLDDDYDSFPLEGIFS